MPLDYKVGELIIPVRTDWRPAIVLECRTLNKPVYGSLSESRKEYLLFESATGRKRWWTDISINVSWQKVS